MENTATNNTQGAKYNPQEYVELADKTYLDFVKGGKYKDIVHSMAGLGDYTLRNQMLILQQNPNATKVNNMNGWNFQKRNVVQGSKSLKILAPVFDSVVTSDDKGNLVEKKSDYVSGYTINFVFDISQTEAKNPAEMRAESENLEPYYGVILKALKETLKSYDFKEADIQNNGILDTRRRTITLKQGLSEKESMKTLVEQIAAALVLGRDRSKFRGLRNDALPNIAAIEITAVSDIVSRRLGLGGQNIQEPNFSEMTDENISKFAENIGVARSVSQIMIKAVDNALTEAMTQEKLAKEKALTQTAADKEPVTVEAEPQTKSRETIKTTKKVNVKAQAEMA